METEKPTRAVREKAEKGTAIAAVLMYGSFTQGGGDAWTWRSACTRRTGPRSTRRTDHVRPSVV
ncbi:hypothetical protein [uncultured Bilophila sp.]|uniref:hypothetical protein n=1 Tax=uncultured Bilophila sp. TaxID=529385 RepID=UPI00280BD636|nr:hypothetical protein [uncultured Bilophila sp.]